MRPPAVSAHGRSARGGATGRPAPAPPGSIPDSGGRGPAPASRSEPPGGPHRPRGSGRRPRGGQGARNGPVRGSRPRPRPSRGRWSGGHGRGRERPDRPEATRYGAALNTAPEGIKRIVGESNAGFRPASVGARSLTDFLAPLKKRSYYH